MIRVGKPDHIAISEEYDLKGAVIMGNQAQIINVFINMLTNAYEAISGAAAEGRGHIWLTGEIVGYGGRRYARIKVKDDGAGMDAGQLAQIYEPYFSARRGGGNAGLGLTVAKNILDQHSASINVESAPGGGAEFVIDFPVMENAG
jgi:signal transduction histidine kinase